MKYLIVADGPFLPKSIILEAARDAHIIALDGAFYSLMHLGIQPQSVLGDFDVFDTKLAESYPDLTLIPMKDQNFTDLQKGLNYCLEQKATSIHIVCALGGRMDHELTNLKSLEKTFSPTCRIFLHTDYQTLWVAENETISIEGKPGDYCGLFGAPQATITIKNNGLAYGDATPFVVSAEQASTSNQLTKEHAIIDIHGKALIVHPPMLNAQRKNCL